MHGYEVYRDTNDCKLILKKHGKEQRLDYIMASFDKYDFKTPGDYRIVLKDIRVRPKWSAREVYLMREAYIDAMKVQHLIGTLWPDQIVCFKCEDIKYLEIINPTQIKS